MIYDMIYFIARKGIDTEFRKKWKVEGQPDSQ